MPLTLKDLSPLRVVIGQEDVTAYADAFTFSSVDPGGFEAASFQFPRDMDATIRGQHVRIDSGLNVAWEGRVAQLQRSLGHQTSINCEGYGALFKDVAASMVFVDRDLTKWQGSSLTRQSNMLSGNFQFGTTQVAADPTNNLPALVASIQDSWVAPFKPLAEAWYDAGPDNLIGKIYYSVSFGGGVIGTDVNWQVSVFVSTDDLATLTLNAGNLHAGASGYFTPASQYRRAIAQSFYNATPAGNPNQSFPYYFHNTAVYGNHGLTGRGSDPVGFYPSDIFGWVLSQVPGLQAGILQQTDAGGYIVPHSAYYTPVLLDQMVNDMAVVQGWHWGVWESPSSLTGIALPRADFRPRPASGAFTAFFHRSACETLDIREDLSQQFDQCIVTFTDVAGVSGAAVATAENPVLDAAGIGTRTLVLSGGTMTQADALAFAAMALLLTNQQARVAGSIDVISPVDAPGPQPAYLLKPGIDRVRIGDAPSTDAFGSMSDYPLTRMEATVSSSGIGVSLEVGQGGDLVETLQARLSAASTLAAQGG